MSSSLLAVQKAIYELLTNDVELMEMISGVFDHVPKGQAFPYVRIGEATEVPWNDFGRIGMQATFVMHIFSAATSSSEANEICARIFMLLGQRSLEIEAISCIDIALEQTLSSIDPGSLNRHLIMRYRIILECASY